MARSLLLISGATTTAILAYCASALAVDCFVDNVGGSDTNNGTSESTPFASISKLTSSCTTVKFKRGNVYKLATGVKNLGITSFNSVKTLTNYGDPCQPLPQFVKDHVNGSGGMIQSFGAITIDGLYLSGSKSANSMSNLADGIGVMLGAGSLIQNCEITLCDIGMMTSGDNVKVLNNYVHDLSISVDAPPGVDPNAVGGAEGIFVNSSHVEVAYNRFINCSTAAAWVTNTNGGGVRCDGGATEVTVGYAGTVTDVRIHHNFSYNSCGLFEVSSMPSTGSGTYVKGNFTNSEFHDNVVVDSGWISLLQINNTRLTNVRWENNTIVHHFLPTVQGKDASGNTVQIDMNDYASSYIQVIPFNSTSSGVTGGGVLEQGDVYWTNNLWYIDPAIKNFSPTDATHASTDQFVKNITISGDKVFRDDPGFVDITSTTDPSAYDLKSGSGAIDVGVSNSNITTDVPTDFVERARPAGNAYDLGAFEYGASNSGAKTIGVISNCGSSTGGAAPTGGASAAGGAQSTGGSPTVGGSQPVAGSAPIGTGGAVTGAGGAQPGVGGGNSIAGSPVSNTKAAAVDQGGCSCRVAGKASSSTAASLLGLLLIGLGLRRKGRSPN
jgi:MYXO-CTERM domain-containing protein